MSVSQSAPRARSNSSIVAAIVVGIPMALGILVGCRYVPEGTLLHRYTSHPIEKVEIIFFCCALAAFGAKFLRYLLERLAFRKEIVPPWDGTVRDVEEAEPLLVKVRAKSGWLGQSRLGSRIEAALAFVVQRKSANELDDQLRTLADEDALALESSYSLTRFITWAIPILGFLGTVLGITGAISNVSPQELENSLSGVTGGLALAFDTTAVALCLTMVAMFCAFVVERLEQTNLEEVDVFVEQHLSHRFRRSTTEMDKIQSMIDENGKSILAVTEQIVKTQADVWARSLAEVQLRQTEHLEQQQKLMTDSLQTALDNSLESHGKRLGELQQQSVEVTQKAHEQMKAIAQGLQGQVSLLHQLQMGEKQLVQLQGTLEQNLQTLAGAGSFEQALHSLTAAIHLLTASRPTLSIPQPERKAA